jgi:hypothetical protein
LTTTTSSPLVYVASRRELSTDEIDTIREGALEASARVGTDREQRGTTFAISKDRSAVRPAIRMDRALREPIGDYGPEEPPYDALHL